MDLIFGFLAVAAVILIAKFVLHFGFKVIGTLLVNAIVGFALIWILNYLGIVTIPLVWWSYLVIGLFGVPGVVVLALLILGGVL